MTLKSINVWVIYRLNTLEHSMVPFLLILESLNEFWENFVLIILWCYNTRLGRKLWPVWRQTTYRKRVRFAHKNSIYSQHFSLNSQCMSCTFSLCNSVKHTHSVFTVLAGQKVEIWWLKQWQFMLDAAKLISFLSSTARPRLRMWSILSSHRWKARDFWS